jgi:hypothetical protein
MYLLFEIRPEGSPEIGDGSYLMPIKCIEGWFVDYKFKQLCEDNGWVDYTIVNEITPLTI